MSEAFDELHDRLDDLENRIDTVERRLEVVSENYVGLDKLQEDVQALKRLATIPDGGDQNE